MFYVSGRWQDQEERREEGYGVQPQTGEGCTQTYTNTERVRFHFAPPSKTTTAGAWVALDANSGEIVWSTANPSEDTSQGMNM